MRDHGQHQTGYFSETDCDIDAFKALVEQTTDKGALRHVDDVQSNIPVYDMARLRPVLSDAALRSDLMLLYLAQRFMLVGFAQRFDAVLLCAAT